MTSQDHEDWMADWIDDWNHWHYGDINQWSACELDDVSGMMIARNATKVTCPKCLKWLEGSATLGLR